MEKTRGFELIKEDMRKHPSVDIILPNRATHKSSGYDFYLPTDVTVSPNSKVFIWSDVKCFMLDDEELLIVPKSGLGTKGIVLSNLIGKIDSDYYSNLNNDGNIGITLWNTSDKTFNLKAGDKVCQGSFYKYLVVDNDTPVSNIRKGGFGSSGSRHVT